MVGARYDKKGSFHVVGFTLVRKVITVDHMISYETIKNPVFISDIIAEILLTSFRSASLGDRRPTTAS